MILLVSSSNTKHEPAIVKLMFYITLSPHGLNGFGDFISIDYIDA